MLHIRIFYMNIHMYDSIKDCEFWSFSFSLNYGNRVKWSNSIILSIQSSFSFFVNFPFSISKLKCELEKKATKKSDSYIIYIKIILVKHCISVKYKSGNFQPISKWYTLDTYLLLVIKMWMRKRSKHWFWSNVNEGK